MSRTECWGRRLTVPVIALALLTGCATARSDPAVVCPPLIAYDPATQARAAEAVEALPADSPLIPLLADYAQVRAQIRACRAGAE